MYELGFYVVKTYPDGWFDLLVRSEDGTLTLRDFGPAPTHLAEMVILEGEAGEC